MAEYEGRIITFKMISKPGLKEAVGRQRDVK